MANGTAPSSPSQNSPEPSGLLHILASVFSGVLFGLFLSKVRTPINKTADSPYGHDSTDYRTANSDDDSLRRIRATEANSPPSPPQCNYSKKKSKHWMKRWKPYVFLLNLATFCAVAWYGCLTNGLLKESRQANKNASDITELTKLNFRKQNRPFVGIVDDVIFVSSSDSKWTVRAKLKNYGVTPARRVVGIAHMLKTRDGWHLEESCRASMVKSNNWATADADAIFPSDAITMNIESDSRATIPPQPYLSVCVSYQDLDIGFRFTWDTGEKVCMTYDTQTLYRVVPVRQKPRFELLGTSVETAQPTLGNNEPCHGY